jgi:hypothetical protein
MRVSGNPGQLLRLIGQTNHGQRAGLFQLFRRLKDECLVF